MKKDFRKVIRHHIKDLKANLINKDIEVPKSVTLHDDRPTNASTSFQNSLKDKKNKTVKDLHIIFSRKPIMFNCDPLPPHRKFR